jgi:hypothetical protein
VAGSPRWGVSSPPPPTRPPPPQPPQLRGDLELRDALKEEGQPRKKVMAAAWICMPGAPRKSMLTRDCGVDLRLRDPHAPITSEAWRRRRRHRRGWAEQPLQGARSQRGSLLLLCADDGVPLLLCLPTATTVPGAGSAC